MLVPSRAGNLRIWDEPLDGRRYVLGADVSEGKVRDKPTNRIRRTAQSEDRPDFSAAIVLDVESGQHVATWHGYLSPIHYAAALAALGWHYNTALLVAEINGPGLGVIEHLVRVIGYPAMYTSKIFGMESMESGEPPYGWRTTGPTRGILINRIEEAISSGFLDTRDRLLAKELRTIQFDDMGVPRARGSDKDDLVMALGLALQGRYESLVGTSNSSPTTVPRGPDDWIWEKRRRELAVAEKRHGLRSRYFVPGLGLRPRG